MYPLSSLTVTHLDRELLCAPACLSLLPQLLHEINCLDTTCGRALPQLDHEFINKHLAPVAESDDFQKRLLEIYNQVKHA